MGKRGKKKDLSKQLSDAEKVGFNTQIPNVTIILTEHSMNNRIVQRLIDECQSSLYYHKFTIRGHKNHTRSYILKSIMEFVHPSDFMPVHFNSTSSGDSYFLARNCLEVIMKIIANKFTVPLPTDPENPLKIIILANCIAAEDVPLQDISSNIWEAVNYRFTVHIRHLNLNRFSNDERLVHYCPLFNPKMFQCVMTQAAKFAPVSVDLAYNNIKDISHLRALKNYVKILDISYNQIDDIRSLQVLSEFKKLRTLRVTNNPLCENYNTYNYVIDIKRFCPSLTQLDGARLGIPEFRQNFVCTPDAAEFAETFLEHFFTVYDSPRRQDLYGLYHQNAIFSVTARVIPGQKNSNSVTLSHYGLWKKFSKYGVHEIINLFETFPKTLHDPYPTVCDVTLYTDTHAEISFSGIFREAKQVLTFTRHFYLKRKGNQFQIVNEQYSVSNALDFQLGWSFAYPPSVTHTGDPIPYYTEQYRELEEILQRITTMNIEYCQKYLIYCNYDLKKALALFSELHVADSVPKEAFEHPTSTPSPTKNSQQMSICEALKKKVFEKYPTLSLKTLYETLKEERMELVVERAANVDTTVEKGKRCDKFYTSPSNHPLVNERFIDREAEKLREANLITSAFTKQATQVPVTQLQPPPTKKPKDDPRAIARSNPSLDLANRTAQYKDVAIKKMESLNTQAKMEQSTTSIYPSTSFTSTPSFVPEAGQIPRPAATTFAQQNFTSKARNWEDGRASQGDKPASISKPEVDVKTPRQMPQLKNSILKPNETTSAANLLKIESISEMRKNLQEEKRKLLELKNNIDLEEAFKKIVKTQPKFMQTPSKNVEPQIQSSKVSNPPVANIISNILQNASNASDFEGPKPPSTIETTDFIKILEVKKKIIQSASTKTTPSSAAQDATAKLVQPNEKSILGKHPLQLQAELDQLKRTKTDDKPKPMIPETTDVADPNKESVYEFLINESLIGRLFGIRKFFIMKIVNSCGVKIDIKINVRKSNYKIVSITGNKSQIENALLMIRDKFPLAMHPELTLKPIDVPTEEGAESLHVTTSSFAPKEKTSAQKPQATTQLPQAASQKPQTDTRKPQTADQKPQTETQKPQAVAQKPQTAVQKPSAAKNLQATPQKPSAVTQKHQATAQKSQTTPQKPQKPLAHKPQATAQRPQSAVQKPQEAVQKPQITDQKPQTPIMTPQTSKPQVPAQRPAQAENKPTTSASTGEKSQLPNFSKMLFIRIPKLSKAEIEKSISKPSTSADTNDIDLTGVQSMTHNKIQIKFPKKIVENASAITQSSQVVEENITNTSGKKSEEPISTIDLKNKPKLNLLKSKVNLIYPTDEKKAAEKVDVMNVDLCLESDSEERTDDEFQIVNTTPIMKTFDIRLPRLSLEDVNRLITPSGINLSTEPYSNDKLDISEKDSQVVAEKEKAITKLENNKELTTDTLTKSQEITENLDKKTNPNVQTQSVKTESLTKNETPTAKENIKNDIVKLKSSQEDTRKKSASMESQEAKEKLNEENKSENIKKQKVEPGSTKKLVTDNENTEGITEGQSVPVQKTESVNTSDKSAKIEYIDDAGKSDSTKEKIILTNETEEIKQKSITENMDNTNKTKDLLLKFNTSDEDDDDTPLSLW